MDLVSSFFFLGALLNKDELMDVWVDRWMDGMGWDGGLERQED